MLRVRTLEVNARKLHRIIQELLPTLLLDVDTIEGKLSGRNERDSDYTDHTTMENVLMGYGGLVAGYNKGFTWFVSL